MIINKIAFGNFKEAFIEEKLKNKVNLIYSNENNKGKTLLIQGLMFSIGNVPIFPSGFDYNNYYFYSQIETSNCQYEFLRKNRTIIIKDNSGIKIAESLSELKYIINKTIFELPLIEKNTEMKLVDLSLFYQLFFIGQDKRNTSNIQNSGQYNKKDFVSMLQSLNGSIQSFDDDTNIEEIRENIKSIKTEITILTKKIRFISENPNIAEYSMKLADQENYKKTKEQLEEINKKITQHRNQRTRETNRKIKLENLLSELNSLNQNIEIGKIKCAECGSTRIIYTNGDMSFEVSNKVVRNNIINSIKEQIDLKEDIINELAEYIQLEQDKQTSLLRAMPVEMKNVLAFSDEILSEEEYSSQILKLKSEIVSLENSIKNIKEADEKSKEKNKLMMESILSKMNSYYRSIDPDGNIIFDKIFTKNEENYSGSEEQEFYFSKILALNDYFNHQFPIIIDSYRSGELSSSKEIKMLEHYKKKNKQIILTSTLKHEEYDKPKYVNDPDLNVIDYSPHESSKILQESYKDDFIKILESFNIYEQNEGLNISS